MKRIRTRLSVRTYGALFRYVRTLGGGGGSDAGGLFRGDVGGFVVVGHGETRSPAAGDAMHVVERLGQARREVTELRSGGFAVAQEIDGVAEKVVGHAELDGLDVVGEACKTARAGAVGDEVTGVAVEVGPGEETGPADQRSLPTQ
ncbi:hypothetical protein [Streptomyces sp. KMM 9044]|uniref:hypothetical protein n=1 Tax=Streptomyces sp. KMM 9044 TaxID=2744474 RepID=UPI00216E4FDA